MNILIPHQWLLEHLETGADPATIQRLTSLSGPSIERVYEKEGESVYDIEVTTNRVDSMSIRGIAREVAVILQQAGIEAKLKPLVVPELDEPSEDSLLVPTIENDSRWCKRILCVVLDNVQHTPTPDWMAKRLRQIDQNVHDSVIDITNYVTHELGHPCHAFDYNKIMKLGGKIVVTEATAGKPFTTLDDATYQTKGGEIVFENGAGEIIDLPAIKGTANTSVDDSTSSVLLWIESLDAQKVRTASMSHAIRTVAAQLNEKNVDPFLAKPTLDRGIELYQQLCSATIASKIYDDFPQPALLKPVVVPLQKIEAYLGISLPDEQIMHILTALECKVSIDNDELTVVPPTFRSDIQIPVDVIEEVARIYGYHNLPSVLMSARIPTTRQTKTNFILEERIKRFLAASGAQELYTYSMVSDELAQQDGFSVDQHLKLLNPLTDDRVYMRRSLIPSLNQALTPVTQPATVFELANVYHPQENDLPIEELHLTIASNQTYRMPRAQVEALLAVLFISQVEIKTQATQTDVATILARGTTDDALDIGTVKIVSDRIITFDFIWSKVLQIASTHPHYEPLPKAAALTEDLTFTLPPSTPIGPIIAAMKMTSPLIQKIELREQYEQNFTFRFTYLDQEKPISGEVVAPIRLQLVATVAEMANAVLVGTLQ
ncbi:phenylalanine--tRNA ligase subunit beta [Candidatus Woesebacteria bacterium]|nr:phenylalanine--tRNA ligase subunit beta [Candidatus Woesebacteria bacterium]